MPPTEADTTVAVVVVNYGSHELLERHLVPLTTAVPTLRAVVVDNFTTTAERAHVARLAQTHGWTDVLLPENLGFGSGVNHGVRRAGDAARLVLLNPDATLAPEDLARLVGHLDLHPLDLVAPRVVTPEGRLWSRGSDLLLACGEMRGWHSRPSDADPATYQPWLSGACLALTRELWDLTGGFDDDYFLYWEDVDLSRRVLDAGGRLQLLDEAVVVHDEGSTHRGDTTPRAKSAIYYYYNSRNRLLFAGKHHSPGIQRRWRRSSATAGYRLLLQGGRRQLKNPRRTVWPVLRGTLDGWRRSR